MSSVLVSGVRAAVAVFALAAALAIAQPALAQETGPAPEPAPPAPATPSLPAGPVGVEEIVITSTKREQNLQEVPIAVSAFTGDDLIARGVDEIEELEEISPSIQMNTSNSASNGGTIRIRGMGTTGNNPGLEAAVGSFVDGVYRSRAGQTFGDLLDIERVEILRGPQGTLFGKNTSAGAVHVITKEPSLDEMDGFGAVEFGNLGHTRVSLSHSMPIVEDVLGYRVSGTWNVRDGYFEDIHTDAEYADRDRYALRGQLLWAPVDVFEARLIADYGERNESCCPAQTLYYGPTSNRFNGFGAHELAASIGLGQDFIDIPLTSTPVAGDYPFVRKPNNVKSQRQVGVNYAPFEDVADWGVSLEMSYELDFATITSITAYRDFHAKYAEDIDFTSADILRPQQGVDDVSEIWSQEIRLAGTAFDKLDWLVGAYFYGEDLFSDERLEFASQGGMFALQQAGGGVLLPEGAGYSAEWKQQADGYAFFTHNTFHILDELSITAGLRFSHEKKDAVGIINGGLVGSTTQFATINGVPQPGFAIGSPVPAGVNDTFSSLALPGGPGWCEDLTASGAGAVRTALRGFCDNASWKDEASEDEFTGQVSIAYAVTENVNTYATYSRGYKAGGFNLDQESVDIITDSATGLIAPGPASATGIVDAARFKPEFANSYEIGIKGTYLGGMARINLAGFWTDFDDFQLNTFNGLGFVITNVPEVRSRGFELEMLLVPSDGMSVNFGVTYADTRYGKDIGLCFPLQYPDGAINNCDPVADVGAATSEFADGGVFQDFFADGHRITNAPAWIGNLSIYGERQLIDTEWMGYGNLGLRYTGRRNTGSNLHPLKFERHHYFLQAAVGVRSPDGHWDMSVWSNNLTNEYENGIIFDSVFQAGSQGAYFNLPRTYGVTVKYNFN